MKFQNGIPTPFEYTDPEEIYYTFCCEVRKTINKKCVKFNN